MCLGWSSRHPEGITVLHILPLDFTADHLARWEQLQESTSLGMAANVCFSVPYLVVQCLVEMESCKDSLCPV